MTTPRRFFYRTAVAAAPGKARRGGECQFRPGASAQVCQLCNKRSTRDCPYPWPLWTWPCWKESVTICPQGVVFADSWTRDRRRRASVRRSLGHVCADVLGDTLVGAILHGSLVLGDYTPGRSDIDLLVVAERELSDRQIAASPASRRGSGRTHPHAWICASSPTPLRRVPRRRRPARGLAGTSVRAVLGCLDRAHRLPRVAVRRRVASLFESRCGRPGPRPEPGTRGRAPGDAPAACRSRLRDQRRPAPTAARLGPRAHPSDEGWRRAPSLITVRHVRIDGGQL
jgi:hypothetical protein